MGGKSGVWGREKGRRGWGMEGKGRGRGMGRRRAGWKDGKKEGG